MLEIISALVPGGMATILGTLMVFLTFIGTVLFKKGQISERHKQAERERRARSEADEIEQAVAGNDPEENRKHLGKWSR